LCVGKMLIVVMVWLRQLVQNGGHHLSPENEETPNSFQEDEDPQLSLLTYQKKDSTWEISSSTFQLLSYYKMRTRMGNNTCGGDLLGSLNGRAKDASISFRWSPSF